jgi:hypothetical protein
MGFLPSLKIGEFFESICVSGEVICQENQYWLIHSSSRDWRVYAPEVANNWVLRNPADASYGMLRVCVVFQKTTHLLCLMVLVLVLSVLIFLALMEHSTFEKVELGTTIHTPFNQLEPIHMPLQRPI